MKKIENLIFDFGGVLYDIDIKLTFSAFKKLQIPLEIWKNDPENIFIQLEKGNINETVFFDTIQKSSPLHPEIDEIIEAFNAILIGLPVENYRYLRRLSKNYTCYLLSNTNQIHYSKFSSEILQNDLTKSFYSTFAKEYYSFRLHQRKPDPEIFNIVINDSGVIPDLTLFIDDDFHNIESAKKLGLMTFHFGTEGNWMELISKFNLNL